MSQKYHIESVDTKYFIISHNEKPGEIVITQNGQAVIPDNSIVTITPPVVGPEVIATVKGVKGLYIALPKDHAPGSKLIWSEEKYEWKVVLTPTPTPGKYPVYQFVPADGENLYWFDKFGIGPVIIVEDGKDIVPPESYFRLIQA